MYDFNLKDLFNIEFSKTLSKIQYSSNFRTWYTTHPFSITPRSAPDYRRHLVSSLYLSLTFTRKSWWMSECSKTRTLKSKVIILPMSIVPLELLDKSFYKLRIVESSQ